MTGFTRLCGIETDHLCTNHIGTRVHHQHRLKLPLIRRINGRIEVPVAVLDVVQPIAGVVLIKLLVGDDCQLVTQTVHWDDQHTTVVIAGRVCNYGTDVKVTWRSALLCYSETSTQHKTEYQMKFSHIYIFNLYFYFLFFNLVTTKKTAKVPQSTTILLSLLSATSAIFIARKRPKTLIPGGGVSAFILEYLRNIIPYFFEGAKIVKYFKI